MPNMISADRQTPSASAYWLVLLAIAVGVYAFEAVLGLGDARHSSGGAMTTYVFALVLAFWPAFAIGLRNLANRRGYRALGAGLLVACMLTVMPVGFAEPVPATWLPGSLPAILLALVAGWLATEISLLPKSGGRRLRQSYSSNSAAAGVAG